jgi:hypothetical protein
VDRLETLGLWGDGDEIFAVESAFESIGLSVPVEDAPHWLTVGDLWESASKLSPNIDDKLGAWDAFRKAVSEETGVDWTLVDHATTLLDGRGHNILSRLFRTIREWVMG